MLLEALQLTVIAVGVFVTWGLVAYLWRNRKE